jgi:flagellar biosynthesis/type III secretory pathway protein FliH
MKTFLRNYDGFNRINEAKSEEYHDGYNEGYNDGVADAKKHFTDLLKETLEKFKKTDAGDIM